MKLKTHVWLIAALAVTASAVALVTQVRDGWSRASASASQSERVAQARALAELVHELQRERGLSLGLRVGEIAPERVLEQQARARVVARGVDADDARRDARREAIMAGRLSPAVVFESFTTDIHNLLSALSSLTGSATTAANHDRLETLSSLARAKEQLGRLRASAIYLWAKHEPGSTLDRAIVSSNAVFADHLRMWAPVRTC